MLKKADKNAKRLQRHKRVRRKVFGTPQRPRLCVFRSSNNIYAQIIDDTNRVTLVAASSLDEAVKGAVNHTGNKEAAKMVGEMVAKKAVEKGITVEVPNQTELVVKGIDKQLVGNYAAKIRDWRKPEPYKGKGIKYAGEYIRRKEGKTGKK